MNTVVLEKFFASITIFSGIMSWANFLLLRVVHFLEKLHCCLWNNKQVGRGFWVTPIGPSLISILHKLCYT